MDKNNCDNNSYFYERNYYKDVPIKDTQILEYWNRHLVQDTQRYSMLLHTSYNPDFLQDAKDRQLFLCAVLKNVEQMQGNMEIAKLEIKDMQP